MACKTIRFDSHYLDVFFEMSSEILNQDRMPNMKKSAKKFEIRVEVWGFISLGLSVV